MRLLFGCRYIRYCVNLIGEVLCTIHTKVLDDHQKELQPGAVLILRQVCT